LTFVGNLSRRFFYDKTTFASQTILPPSTMMCRVVKSCYMNIEAYNLSLFEKLSEKELGDWMYDGFVLLPARGRDDRSNLLHAQQIYKSLPENLKQKVDRVLVDSINKWTGEAGDESLDNMVAYAALTQNKAAIPLMIGIIDSGMLEPHQEDKADPFTTIIAVLGGYAEDPEAKKALLRWYADPNFSWNHVALLASGLANSGESIKAILPHLLTTIDEHPGYFREDLIAAELSRLTGVDVFEEEIGTHKGNAAKKMRKFMPLIREILKEGK
jgi:hypothetical protein